MDEHGCPLAVIDWHVGDSDVESFRVVYELFAAEWNRSSLADIASLAPRPPEAWRRDLVLGGGIYHPGGSIRIGSTPQRGVVDDRLRTFRISDLWVVTTATFPSGGSANPTLMLMLFALRAADDILTRIRG